MSIPPSVSHSRSGRTSLLRSRGVGGHGKVTNIELFFDLVFVYAVTQLSDTLLHHMDATGAAQTLFLFLAVWWVRDARHGRSGRG